jgi:ferric-dicitrate binding protein FerR (iron transport regulator)
MEPMTPLQELGREVARAQDLQLERGDALDEARGAVLREPAAAPKATWARRGLFAGTGLSAAAAAFLAVVLWPRAIELTVGEGPGARVSGDFVVAGPQAPLPLRFSDGSAVDLEPGASARILHRDRRGVTLLLEGGRLAATVVHRPDTGWKMRAGPFEVRVTGTKFDLEWNVGRGSLTLIGLQARWWSSAASPGGRSRW